MADRLRDEQKFELLQKRFIGIGNPDTTREEWLTNVQRDSLTSYVGHGPLLEMFSVAYGEPPSKVRHRFIDQMIDPLNKNR